MAGKTYSDIFAVSNTNTLANTDLLALQRGSGGNTYVFQANALYNYVSSVIFTNQRNVVSIIGPTVYNALANDDVILCDTVHAGANITISFPSSPANGKEYTVKLTNANGSVVTITTSNTSVATVEATSGGSAGNTTSLTSIGQFATWTFYNGVYRKIG